jgi:hypothetical protein
MLDISQIKQLGSFSDTPTRYHKEFLCLTRAYALTWGDIYNIINDTFMEDEKERIWKAAEQHTAQLHEQHSSRHAPTTEAVPKTEPQWSYQDENPALLLNRLMKAMIKYTNLNSTSQESHIFLHHHFISQSATDI